jgi:two-component system KDP operon response regulator KdpE
MKEKARAKILLVDDDHQIVRLFRTLLESHGYECLTASSGGQGLVRFAQTDVDLIMTDLNMAVGDGITLIQTIRRTSDVPIVVVSGFVGEWIERMSLVNNLRVLAKPVEMAALLRQVRSCCQLPRLLRGGREAVA